MEHTLGKLQSGNGNWNTDMSQRKRKTAGEFSQNEWEKLLGEADSKRKAEQEESMIQKLTGTGKSAPYSRMSKDGVITYNGVRYVCDYNTNSLCLGDMSDFDNILIIQLSTGGCLKVNRNSLDSLAASLDMFSPQDITAIMSAVTRDNKLKQMQKELEDEASGATVVDQKAEEQWFLAE